VLIKILYVVLVLCTIALVGAVAAGYFKIRRHMRGADKDTKSVSDNANEPQNPTGNTPEQ
jgi:hypothetical protein